MDLDRDFHEFVASCIDHDVRFLIVGGYALAADGLPRATDHLDAWVWTDSSNTQRLLAALSDFGFGSVGLTSADLERPDSVVQLGYTPHRIDILTGIDCVDFESAWTAMASSVRTRRDDARLRQDDDLAVEVSFAAGS
jgi:hypothetical protein